MGLQERVRNQVIAFKGQKSGQPLESYGFESAEGVKNFVLKEGQLRRVNGGTIYADVLDGQSGGVLYLGRFKNLTVAQRGTSVCLETAEGSGVFQTVLTGLTQGKRLFATSWRDRLILANGYEAKFILNRKDGAIDDNIKVGDLGVDPEHLEGNQFGSVTITETDLGSGEIASGFYYYTLTFFDGETNSESPGIKAAISQDGIFELSLNATEFTQDNFGPHVRRVTVSSGPSSVTFDKTTLITYLEAVRAQNPRITFFSIYRATPVTDFNSNLPRYNSAFVVPNTAYSEKSTIIGIDEFIYRGTDFIDNTATADLPAISPPENNSPPPTMERLRRGRATFDSILGTIPEFSEADNSGIRYVKTFRDQIFAVGAFSTGWDRTGNPSPFFTEKGRNAFSSILYGSEVYQPDYYPYIWEVGRGDGQEAKGLGVLGDTALLILKNGSTYYLSGSSPADYVVRILDPKRGTVHESTIQDTPFGVVALDRSGFVLFDRIAQGRTISRDIQDVIDSILFQYANTFYSFYDPKEMRYYCSVVVAGNHVPNLTVCLDLQSMEWTTIQGIEGRSRYIDLDSNGDVVDILGSATNGRLVDLSNEEVVTNQGGAIESIWTSGAFNFGDDQHKKRMRWLYLKVKANADWSINIEIIPDTDESRKQVISGLTYDSEQRTWYTSDASSDGTLIWDEGNWAFDGLERVQLKIPIQCKGRIFQVRIINRDTDANRWGFTLEGISAEAAMLGK